MTTTTMPKARGQENQAITSFPWSFLALALGFAWLLCLPGILAGYGFFTLPLPNTALTFFAQFGASLAAFVLVYREEGMAGVKQLLKRALNFRIGWRWLAVIGILPLALAVAARYLLVLAGGQPPAAPLLGQPVLLLLYLPIIFFLQGPVPEEFGWRGYALDRLQGRWRALVASLVLGCCWALYHLPAYLLPGVPNAAFPLLPFFVTVIAFTVLMTWVYNNTGRNLLAALLFHTMINYSLALFPPVTQTVGGDQRAFLYLTLLYVVTAALVVWRWGAQTLTRKTP